MNINGASRSGSSFPPFEESEFLQERVVDGTSKRRLRNNLIRRLTDGLAQMVSPTTRKVDASGQYPHHQSAFRILLLNEAKRSARSGRSFHVILTYLSGPEGLATRMDDHVTEALVPILSSVLRETDYVGWYRDGHVLGGVLTALGEYTGQQVSARIEQRFWWRMRKDFLVNDLVRLRVRVFQAADLERVEAVNSII